MKACSEKALSLNPQNAYAWSCLGAAGGGPGAGGMGWCGQGGVRWPSVEGPLGLFQAGCVRGQVKRLFFGEGGGTVLLLELSWLGI